MTVHDDAESTRGTHRTLVGGYNGGTKGLVSKAGKDILQVNLKKHLNSHEIQKGFKKVISKGKVKAK